MYRSALPGIDLIEAGIADLQSARVTVPSLLVSIGASKLRQFGYVLPAPIPEPEHTLYAFLAKEDQDSAHGRYNALVRRLVSFERAIACAR